MEKKYNVLHNIMLYSVFIIYVAILFMLLFLRGKSIHSYNIMGNIILFIPLGGYITLFNSNKKFVKNLLWILAVSICVEIIQYILRVGVADIDDVILNVLGGGIGIIVYGMLLFILKDIKKVRYVVEIIAPVIGLCFLLSLLFNNR